MSLKFIFGNSGSGKSYHLYQDLVRKASVNPGKNFIILVPEQFTMQTQKDLCLASPCGGIMNIDVLSFGRLAHRIFEEVGKDDRLVLDDEGKNLILRKIAGDYEEELTVLKGNLKKQGYIGEVKSVISEFTQYGIDFQRLDEFMEELETETYLHYKLSDIRKIYEGFESFLADKYITKEEMLDVLSSVISQSEILRDCVVAMDGFTGFTPVQNRLIGELMRVCDEVIITVEMDSREDPFVCKTPYQLFALSKQLVASLVKLAEEKGTELADPVYLYHYPPVRFKNNSTMAFLEKELFRFRGKTHPAGNGITFYEASNPREEAKLVAERIRRLVRTKGYRYRDIAVIASDMNVYADALEKACSMYGIPVFMDHKKSILLNAFVEYLRSLLTMVEQNFTYESVFRHFRTGLTGFSSDEIDRMENYCIALGIKGYKKWKQIWVRRSGGIQSRDLDELNCLRKRFAENVENLIYVLKKKKKNVREITQAVFEYLTEEKIQEKLVRLEQQFQEEGNLALSKEYAQVYRITIDLFDKFVSVLGDEYISLKEYCDLLDAGLEEAKVGVIPPSLDQVVIGDMERTRIKNIKALFFMGANDTLLPGNTGMGGLLSERDRERFTEHDILLSPGPKEKMYIQKFYLYLNLTKPSEFLLLSWSRTSSDGKTIRPAYLIREIRRMFSDIKLIREEEGEICGRELTHKTGMYYIAEGIRERRKGVSREWQDLYTWMKKEGTSEEELEQVLKAGFLSRKNSRLNGFLAEKLYSDKSRVSVTRLEQFASCAYAHFLSYGLRLTDRERYEFEAPDLGNIAHQALERFAVKVNRENFAWTELTPDRRNELIDESVEESVIDYGNTVLFSSARNEYMIRRIRQLLRRSVWALTKQLEKGDFKPGGFEMSFGSGKIDRVDTCEDENYVYVKVTDYKTGMKSFDITALYYGLQMQLPVYLNAAVQIAQRKHPDKEIVPAGIFYYRIQDPVVQDQDSDEEVETAILKELKLDGLVNGEDNIIDHMEHDLKGSSVLFPFGRNKDGSLSRSSRALPGDAFKTVLRYAVKKEEQLKSAMYSGEMEASPFELGDSTGCDYCGYRDICGFDLRIDGCGFRRYEKYSLQETVEKMEKVLEEAEENGDGLD